MNEDSIDLTRVEEDWPKDGDRLFVESSWATDAAVANDPGERFYRLPMGYKRAGDILAVQAEENVVDRSNVIYATVFCYRQSVELFLKRLIDEFADRKAADLKLGHDLKRLWERCREVFQEHCQNDSIGIEAVEALILELHRADVKSDGFRFPTARDGKEFEHGFGRINLQNLQRTMAKLEMFFECAYAAIEAVRDTQPTDYGAARHPFER